MNISIVLPAYKEADNLRIILPKLKNVLEGMKVTFEILVVDTMQSLDDTCNVCDKEGVKYVKRQGGNLYGDAIRTGISVAQGDYIVVMDADGSHNPGIIKRFYKEVKGHGYNLVIGSRYCKGGDSHNGLVLKGMSWILNVTYRMLFNLKVKDVSDSFRMYESQKLKQLHLECDNFDIVEEILIRLYYKFPGLMIKEVPIYFKKRKYGKSKRDLVKFVKSYVKTILRLLKIRKQESGYRYKRKEDK